MADKLVFIATLLFVATVAFGQSASSLGEMAEQGLWICAVHFDILIDRRIASEYTYGSVAIGSSKDQARAMAVREWLITSGVPFCRATRKTRDGHQIGNLIAYPSFLGIRGSRPESWSDSPMADNGHSMILSALLRVHEVRQLSLPFTLDLKIVISPYGGIESGECRLNGRVESKLLAALENLPWPTGESPYMVKQYYIIEEVDEPQ